MVAPLAVDMEVLRRIADLVQAQLLHDSQRVGVLGSHGHLDPVETDGEEAVVDHQRNGTWHQTAAGVLLIDPIADRRKLRRASHDVVHRQLAGEGTRDLDRERHGRALARHPPEPSHQLGKAGLLLRRIGGDGGVPHHQPLVVPPAHLTPRGGVVGVEGPQQQITVSQSNRPADQWSLPTICSTACTTIGSSTASASFTPPREPGRLTTRHSPTTPEGHGTGRQRVRRLRRRTPGSPRRSPAPRGRATGA